jgi:hypothetical protein
MIKHMDLWIYLLRFALPLIKDFVALSSLSPSERLRQLPLYIMNDIGHHQSLCVTHSDQVDQSGSIPGSSN